MSSRWRRKNSGKNKLLLAVGVAVLACLVFYLYNSEFFFAIRAHFQMVATRQVNSGGGVDIDASKQNQFGVFQGDAVVCNKDYVFAINQGGEEKWRFPLNIGTPVLNMNARYILVADKGGSKLRLFDGGGLKTEMTMEEPIVDAQLSQGGLVTVITRQRGYKGAVLVYNEKGELLFRWLSGGANIMSAGVSPDGKRLAASLCDTSGDSIAGGVQIFNIQESAEPYFAHGYTDCLFSGLTWGGDGSLTLVGDHYTISLDKEGKERWRYDYGGRPLSLYSINEPGHLALVFPNNFGEITRDSDVEFIDGGGSKTGSYKAAGEVRAVDIGGGWAAVAGQREISIVGKSGTVRDKIALNYDLRGVRMLPSGRRVLTVSGAKAELIDVN